MSTGFNRLMNTAQLPAIGKGRVGAPASPPPGKVGVKVKAAIFFDGTGNNRFNVENRLKDSSYKQPHFWHTNWKDEAESNFESYEQYYSNVAILYFMHQKTVPGEHIVSLYMEGIGTADGKADDKAGGGFGSGITGVVARVNRGITELSEEVRRRVKKVSRYSYLQELTVYAFGFSRGAAAARHFCARRVDKRGGMNSICQELGVKSEVVKIKFVGLFDTVSSFDQTDEETPATPTDDSYVHKARLHLPLNGGDQEFRNDVPELHLTLDDPTLERVVHLVAADEYRFNFSSTSIASALQRGTGYEIRLPGAHSDVGGGYALQVDEELTYGLDFSRTIFYFFKNLGWYDSTQGTPSLEVDGADVTHETIVGRRQKIPNTYQYVALSIMLHLAARAQSGLTFNGPNKESERGIKYYLPPGTRLYTIKQQLEKFALARFPATQTLTAPLGEADYRWLRHNLLHLSWSNSVGFEFRRGKDGLPTRLRIPG